jgi:hypothetical protein
MLKQVVVLMLAWTLFAPTAYPQSKAKAPNPFEAQKSASYREAMDNSIADEPHQRLQQQLIARAMADRQAALRRDTEKLVALAAELKRHVDKTDANILSMDVIKKAQEIQKLAKSVQDKMRNAY